jgi:ribosomal protein S18 acetylase RimI-like enzyme
MNAAVSIAEVSTADQLEAVRRLFRAYQDQLFEKCQLPDSEWQTLPGAYARPAGGLLLATISAQAAGCVALRPFSKPATCEMKRLFVAPECRGSSVGRMLVESVMHLARNLDYRFMRLDTHPATMGPAVRLYKEYGFREVSADPMVPVEGLCYMELEL